MTVRRDGRQRRGDRHGRHRLRQAGPATAVGAPSPRRRTGRPAGCCRAGSRSRASRSATGCCAPPAVSRHVATRLWRSVTQDCRSQTRWPGWRSGYDARSLAPRAHVHPGGPGAEAFADAGWSVYEPTLFMLASVARVLRLLGTRDDPAARHDDVVDDAWLASDERALRYGEAARSVLEAGNVTFATIRDEQDEVLARGRAAFHGTGSASPRCGPGPTYGARDWVAAVLRSLLTWGAEQGATTTYLQVVRSNDRPEGSTRRAATRCTTATTT